MINIDYNNGEIKVTTEGVYDLYQQEQLPLILEIVQQVTKKVIWSSELHNYGWATFPNTEMVDVIIRDKKNTIVTYYPWNCESHGDYHYKSFNLYCKNILAKGKKPKGIAIGTHNGEFGEWVPLQLKNQLQSILVEGSVKQFDELFNNFHIKDDIIMLNALVTPNGGDVEFFEGGRGYTNSVVESVIRNWETEEIHSTIKSSLSINELISSYYPTGMDWLHTDIEGLDAKLIMAIEENLLPNFIIFEDNNLDTYEKNQVYNWLIERNYKLHSEKSNCTAIRL